VAKIAGKDSALLQISSDERARVGRIADLFTEEELARHLQIMLRTHGELGYRQEQRFHLELGLLKMAHAQRLLPIEQLLSEAAASTARHRRPVLRHRPEQFRVSADGFAAPSLPHRRDPNGVAVCGRLGAQGQSQVGVRRPVGGFAGGGVRATQPPGITWSLWDRPRPPWRSSRIVASANDGATRPARPPGRNARDPSPRIAREANADSLRDAVLNALGNQQMLVSMLRKRGVELNGNSLIAKVAASSTMIEMSFTADARRIAGAAASGLAGDRSRCKSSPAERSTGGLLRHAGRRSGIERKRAQPRRTGPDRATHAGKIRSRNPHRD
jgi:DNA polymerase III subunit gamma/tau